MKAIRVQNLRSLVDTGFIDLKPVTLLLGQNSSGKSTFLRCLPLFRQSIESQTTGPILWYGRFVDFGSFQESVRKGASENEISFHFIFYYPKYIDSSSFHAELPLVNESALEGKEHKIELMLKIAGETKQDTSWATGCQIRFADEHLIDIKYDVDCFLTYFSSELNL